jgi:uncharacterized membrane protein YdjX (TVP38/TMEM64 family)
VSPSADDHHIEGEPRRRGLGWRLAPAVVIAALVVLAYALGLHRDLTLETFIQHRAAIDRFIAAHIVLALAAFVTLYVATVGLSLPCGGILTVTGGFLFGPVLGTAASAIGALAGGTVIFLIARTAIGEALTRRAGSLVAKLAEGFRADAFNYLLFLRLVPFPFWLVNLAPALFGVRLKTFLLATAIGILPATFAFATFGAGLGSVIAAHETHYNACVAEGRAGCTVDFDLSRVLTPTLLLALLALGILALLPVLARRLWGRKLGTDLSPNGP